MKMDIKWSLESICTNTTYDINKSLYRIGRHREHDIVCGSVVISREHAILIVQCSKLYVKDLGVCMITSYYPSQFYCPL